MTSEDRIAAVEQNISHVVLHGWDGAPEGPRDERVRKILRAFASECEEAGAVAMAQEIASREPPYPHPMFNGAPSADQRAAAARWKSEACFAALDAARARWGAKAKEEAK